MKRRLAVSLLGGLALPAAATSLTPLNLSDLVAGSPEIVVGTVTAVRASSATGFPTTEVHVTISETLFSIRAGSVQNEILALGKRTLSMREKLPAGRAYSPAGIFVACQATACQRPSRFTNVPVLK